MERIFKKNFIYAVDCYEIWQNQKCIEQKSMDAEIYGITYGDSILIIFIGETIEGFPGAAEFHLNSPMSMILRPTDDGIIQEGRIQYFNDGYYVKRDPYLCHLFCKFGRISYVRLATPAIGSDPLYPLPDKLYEFYGDMIEVGPFGESYTNKIPQIISSIIQTSKKTCGISMDKFHNNNMIWKDMTNLYKRELLNFSRSVDYASSSIENLVLQYTESQIASYFESMGYVPLFTIDHICNDVYNAVKSLPTDHNIETAEQLKLKAIYDLSLKY